MLKKIRAYIVHLLGGYTEADVLSKMTLQTPVHYVTTMDLETIVCTQEISMADLAVFPESMFKAEICRQLAENLMDFTCFSLCGPILPDFCHYTMTGEINVLRTELGGVVTRENYHRHALREAADAAEVDRGGGSQ